MMTTRIVGIGMTPVGEFWDRSLRELAFSAGQEALQSAELKNVDAVFVANAYGHTFNQQSHLASLVVDELNLDAEPYSIDAGDASGGAAIRMAHLAVSSGIIKTALVIGVEKATDIVGTARNQARNTSLDADKEAIHGATLPAMAALLMRRYLHTYQVELSAFEGFSINAHQNGSRNPHAMYRNRIKAGSFAKAPMIADPVSLFDSAPDGDGAAAIILTHAEQGVRIAGSAVGIDSFTLDSREDVLHFRALQTAVTRALEQADCSMKDVSVLETHDAFTIFNALSFEAMGLAERGTGWQWSDVNMIGPEGVLPTNTFGGLKSRGNPAGASGVYQAVEATLQLTGGAGENQIRDARLAMIQSLAGIANTAYVHILSNS